uniref:Uncharacterized protein n=1 Tax=Meloidogyne enterolobii TaxID=390850 RepID=A0A6V7WLX5_MELEN|nr:unnamed protein product [Meloidogyne enterolobii]
MIINFKWNEIDFNVNKRKEKLPPNSWTDKKLKRKKIFLGSEAFFINYFGPRKSEEM